MDLDPAGSRLGGALAGDGGDGGDRRELGGEERTPASEKLEGGRARRGGGDGRRDPADGGAAGGRRSRGRGRALAARERGHRAAAYRPRGPDLGPAGPGGGGERGRPAAVTWRFLVGRARLRVSSGAGWTCPAHGRRGLGFRDPEFGGGSTYL